MPTKAKPKNTSRPPRDSDQIAAVIARAPARPRRDADSPRSKVGDWDHAIVSHSLGELRTKFAAWRTRGRGRGWQTHMDNALRDWLKTHTPVAD